MSQDSAFRLLVFLAALLAFWSVILAASRVKQVKGLEVKPFMLIYRLGLSASARDRVSLLDLTLRRVSWIGLPAIAVSALLFYYSIGEAVYYRYFSPQPPPDGAPRGVVPLLPGVTIPLDVNLLIILFSIGVAVLAHELGHALSAISLNLRVKDSGLILFAFIPAAFVEIDEGDFSKASRSARVRVLSAGVLANLTLAVLILLLLTVIPSPQPDGVMITSVDYGTPAYRSGLKPGDVIVSVEDEKVKSISEFRRVLESLGVYDPEREVNLRIVVDRGGELREFEVVKAIGESRIGVTLVHTYSGINEALVLATTLIEGVFLINIALAVVNAGPIVLPTPWGSLATDGAQIVRELLTPILGERVSSIATSALGLATLLLLISVITLEPLRLLP